MTQREAKFLNEVRSKAIDFLFKANSAAKAAGVTVDELLEDYEKRHATLGVFGQWLSREESEQCQTQQTKSSTSASTATQ